MSLVCALVCTCGHNHLRTPLICITLLCFWSSGVAVVGREIYGAAEGKSLEKKKYLKMCLYSG